MNKINKVQSSGKWSDIFFKQVNFRTTLADKDKARLYGEIKILLNAGLDVKSAVELLQKESVGLEKDIMDNVDRSLVTGKSLSEALKSIAGFSNYEVYSIRIGEETGNLNLILLQLELYYQRKVRLKRQLMSALSYPVFVLTLAVSVVYFMLNNIVPMFEDIFKRFGGELPPLTRALLRASYLTQHYSWIFLVGIGAVAIYFYLNRKKPDVRAFLAKVTLKIPVFGETIRKIYLARFCQVMHLLTASKVPLTEALAMVEQMISFYPLELSMPVIRRQITNGISLNKAMGEFPVYEKRMIALIKVAEEVNQLDEMFDKIAVQYNDDIDHKAKILSSVLEPVLIVFIATVVGLILVAMYLPLFKLSTTIG